MWSSCCRSQGHSWTNTGLGVSDVCGISPLNWIGPWKRPCFLFLLRLTPPSQATSHSSICTKHNAAAFLMYDKLPAEVKLICKYLLWAFFFPVVYEKVPAAMAEEDHLNTSIQWCADKCLTIGSVMICNICQILLCKYTQCDWVLATNVSHQMQFLVQMYTIDFCEPVEVGSSASTSHLSQHGQEDDWPSLKDKHCCWVLSGLAQLSTWPVWFSLWVSSLRCWTLRLLFQRV